MILGIILFPRGIWLFMVERVFIGLEAHDGTGKSSTARLLARMFDGDVFFTPDEIKHHRRSVYASKPLTKKHLQEIHATYLEEQRLCLEQTKDASFVVLDRTWYSHAVEQNVRDELDRKVNPTYTHQAMPEDLQPHPSLVFQILIPEEERRRRVESRGEALTARDERLNNDDEYRRRLEEERSKFGCIPLRLRLRDQETCALRAAQVILGHPNVPPLNIVHRS